MKILINDIAVKRDSGGVFTVLSDVYDAAKQDSENEYVFLLGSQLFENTRNIQIVVRTDLQNSYIKRTWFDLISGHKYIESFKPDVVASLQNTAVLGLPETIQQYDYIHQSIPFQKEKKFSPFKKIEKKLAFYQYVAGALIKFEIKFAKNLKVIVQSEWLKNVLVKDGLKRPEDIIVSVPATPEIQIETKKQKSSTEKISYFYPSTAMIYKNHKVVVDAIQKMTQSEQDKIEVFFTITKSDFDKLVGLPVPNAIKLLGPISRDKVMDLMASSVLIFPSYTESFGLPIIEAKGLERTLVVTDVPVLKETVGDYQPVHYFSPFDSDALKMEMLKVDNESNARTISCFNHDSFNKSSSLAGLIDIFRQSNDLERKS